jgi:hypothetical protein
MSSSATECDSRDKQVDSFNNNCMPTMKRTVLSPTEGSQTELESLSGDVLCRAFPDSANDVGCDRRSPFAAPETSCSDANERVDESNMNKDTCSYDASTSNTENSQNELASLIAKLQQEVSINQRPRLSNEKSRQHTLLTESNNAIRSEDLTASDLDFVAGRQQQSEMKDLQDVYMQRKSRQQFEESDVTSNQKRVAALLAIKRNFVRINLNRTELTSGTNGVKILKVMSAPEKLTLTSGIQRQNSSKNENKRTSPVIRNSTDVDVEMDTINGVTFFSFGSLEGLQKHLEHVDEYSRTHEVQGGASYCRINRYLPKRSWPLRRAHWLSSSFVEDYNSVDSLARDGFVRSLEPNITSGLLLNTFAPSKSRSLRRGLAKSEAEKQPRKGKIYGRKLGRFASKASVDYRIKKQIPACSENKLNTSRIHKPKLKTDPLRLVHITSWQAQQAIMALQLAPSMNNSPMKCRKIGTVFLNSKCKFILNLVYECQCQMSEICFYASYTAYVWRREKS